MTSFDSSFVPLEFLRPLWLIVFFIIVIATAIRFIFRTKFKHKLAGQSLIAAHLSAHIVSKPSVVKRLYFSRFYLLASIMSLALAGPSFRSVNIPLHEMEKAQVIVFDLSYSMYATDLKPNRLSQARYKAIDFIKQSQEGETGLIAYAGDAFVISPLTTDARSILHQIQYLSPDIMPVTGSRPDLALNKAIDLLKNAGYKAGHIIFITDGIKKSIAKKMIDTLAGKPWIVSVLSVGTKKGAPIKMPDGSLLKNSTGNIIIPKVNINPLEQLTKAGDGLFLNSTYTGNEVAKLADYYQPNKLKNEQKNRKEKRNAKGFMKDDGYWITFILLPLLLLLFRKGIFFILILGVTIPFIDQPVQASIWHNQQQNALQAYQAKNYKLASELYKSPLEKGSAYYQEKNYKSALAQFKRAEIAMPNNSTVLYNKGNALAQLKQLDKAIAAYKQAISIKPNFKQAIENKKLLEALKKKKQQNKKQQNKKQQNKSKSDKNKQNKGKSDKNKQNKGKSDKNKQNKGKSDKNKQNKGKSDKNKQNKDQSDKNKQNKTKQNKDQSDKNKQNKKPQNKDQSENKQPQKAQKSTARKNKDPSAQANAATATNKENKKNKEQEKMPVWMKNMPDDPSFLLKREMQIEYQKRARSFNPNNNNGDNW